MVELAISDHVKTKTRHPNLQVRIDADEKEVDVNLYLGVVLLANWETVKENKPVNTTGWQATRNWIQPLL